MTHAAEPAILHCHYFILWLTPVLERFPSQAQRSIGKSLENAALNMLSRMVTLREGYMPLSVTEATQQLHMLQQLWQQALESNCLPVSEYQAGQTTMHKLSLSIDHWVSEVKGGELSQRTQHLSSQTVMIN